MTKEQSIVKNIWITVLGVHSFGVEDSFFDIGGHSLKVPQVIMKINSELQTDISFFEFYNNSSIKKICELICKKKENSDSKKSDFCDLIKLNDIKDHKKIFFIHGGNARISTYLELVKSNFINWEIFGIELYRGWNLTNNEIVCSDLASSYVKLIKNKQKSGPYHIFGTCIGGTISFEVARQLEKIYKEKVFLYLASSEAPEKQSEDWSYKSELSSYLNQTFTKFNLAPNDGWAKLEVYLENNGKSLEKLAKYLEHDIHNLEKNTISELLYRKNLTFDLLQMRKSYYPNDVLESKVIYFNAIEQPIDNRKNWSKHCENIYYIDVDGNHDSMFQADYCKSIGLKLKEELQKNEVI